jgi:hypothetical protein
MTSIFIGMPSYGGIAGSAFLSHVRLSGELIRARIEHTFHVTDSCSDVVRARANIVSAFLAGEWSHMLMVDADIAFEPSAVRQMVEFGQDFVGVAVPLRKFHEAGLKRAVERKREYPFLRFAWQFNVELGKEQGDNPLAFEVISVGTAMVMLRREAVEKMARAYPEVEHVDTDGRLQVGLFNHIIESDTRRLLGEDISFCRRWTSLGGKIWCLRDCKVTHTGPLPLTGNIADVADHLKDYTP